MKLNVNGHTYGTYLKMNNLGVVTIPKNATTTLKEVCGWNAGNFIDEQPDRYVVILRDPYDRFLSAVNMLVLLQEDGGEQRRLAGLLKITGNGIYTEDCHYTEQFKFILTLNLDAVDFFWYNDNVISEINDYYNLGFKTIPRCNSNSKKLITGLDEEWIKRVYKHDYRLIEKVNFKNREKI